MNGRVRIDFDDLMRHLMMVGFFALVAWTLVGAYGTLMGLLNVAPEATLRFLLSVLILVFSRRTYWEIREWRSRNRPKGRIRRGSAGPASLATRPVPNLRDFERRLGGLVEGLFSKTFRSGVQPVEIAKLILREMDSGRAVGVSEVWAPNRFEVSLSEADAERLHQVEGALITELKQVVRDNASERGWGLVGPPEIELVAGPGLKKGDLSCVASLVDGAEKVEPVAPGGLASIVVHEDDEARTVPLRGE